MINIIVRVENRNEFIEYLEHNQEEDGTEILYAISKVEFKIKNLYTGDRHLNQILMILLKKVI